MTSRIIWISSLGFVLIIIIFKFIIYLDGLKEIMDENYKVFDPLFH